MNSKPYPVKESNHPASEIKYYYCSEKGKKAKETCNYPHGTILNTKKEVVLLPSVYVTYQKPKSGNMVKHKIIDCTIVNFYNVDGHWRMGTRNSWDISYIEEFTGLTNQSLFDEAVEKCQYTFDLNTLNKSKMHTFAFSNPKCHLFSNQCRVWSYNQEYEFVGSPELASPEDTNYIEFYPETGELVPVQTDIWKYVTDVVYTNRMRIVEQEINYDLAIAKLIIQPLFKKESQSVKSICEFMENHLNEHCLPIYKTIMACIQEIDEYFGKDILSHPGDKRLLIGAVAKKFQNSKSA
jgi:hypothetical protein